MNNPKENKKPFEESSDSSENEIEQEELDKEFSDSSFEESSDEENAEESNSKNWKELEHLFKNFNEEITSAWIEQNIIQKEAKNF